MTHTGNNPAIDDAIDDTVDRVMKRFKTESPEDFAKRVRGISGIARAGIIVMIHEQIHVEGDESRKNDLTTLLNRVVELN